MEKKFDYLVESERTLSDSFYGNQIKTSSVKSSLVNFSNASSELDRVKKAMFYGRDLEAYSKGVFKANFIESHKNLFHAIIGIATEAGELVDAYRKWMKSDESDIDIVNLCEEVGDIFWYAAIIAREAGVSFEDIQRNNIEKLAKRFPDKFTEFNANNRDLSAEREILETVIPSLRAPDKGLFVQQLGRGNRVELPNSIEAEVSCISKSKLEDALLEWGNLPKSDKGCSAEEFADWIFKNFA